MAKLTITEALAEVPTITKRLEKKQEFILTFLFRQSAVRDPHEKDGGSAVQLSRELQAIKDLQDRLIAIRAAIQQANATNSISVDRETRTITDWLTWRREVAPKQQAFWQDVANRLKSMRQKAVQQGVAVTDKDVGYSADWVININERDLADKIESLETMLGTLDGQLSLRNATIQLDL